MPNNVAVINRIQTFPEKVFMSFVTFTSLGFCIWLSEGSRWWTFLTGTMFLLVLFEKIAEVTKAKTKNFTTKKELVEWAETLDWKE